MGKLRLGVLIESPKPDYHYSDIQVYRLNVVTINDRDEVRNPSDSAWGDDAFTRPFADLAFRTQGPVVTVKPEVTYGWSIEYREVYNVDLQKAEVMVKMLRRISKIKMPVQPATFGQFVQLTCLALGIEHAVQLRGRGRGWHNENEYAIFKIQDAQSLVDRMVMDFLEANRVKPVAISEVSEVA